VRVAMQKVEGVQKVQVSLKEGLTTLELRADNRVTLAQLRTVIKNNGFVSRDATITARGTIGTDGFEVRGTGERLPFTKKPVAKGDSWDFTTSAAR
jgi:copper chaperone CopZ